MGPKMDKAEKNRRLAEWLGLLAPTKDETEECLRERRYDVRRWTLHRHNNAPIERFSSYYWQPADFYSSEEASALLLEKMPDPMLWKESDTLWGCEARNDHHNYEYATFNADRKTCIAEAALRLMESGK